MSEYTGDNKSYPGAPCRSKLFTRWGQLKSERASWLSHWIELSSYLLPRSGRFFTQNRNKGQRMHNQIYDNTGTRALRILGAGMMAGATSPARPWFRLGVSDPEMNKYHAVKVWLNDVTMLMQRVFQKSNTYRTLHGLYEELATFGTAATIILPNYQNVIHNYPLTCGEYAIATDYEGKVCTLYREFEKPVSEVVKEFGYENCSSSVKHMFDCGTLDAWIPLIHAIEPRADRDIRKKDNKNMPWCSVYFEVGGEGDKLLRESGFPHFPALVPRWAIAGGDMYGNSPGMEALGDVKQLQHEQLRKAQGIDYKVRPPVQAPTAMKNREIDMLPGGVSYYDSSSPSGGIKNLFEVNIDLNHLLQDIQDCRERIRGAFYADLFMMLANATDTRMTATEVAMRQEEKLIMLGPVMERLHNELLNPLIEVTFSTLLRAGVIPPPPDELNGVELNVEFISILAQAQRAIGANSIDRYVGSLGAVAQFKPEVLDKFNADEYADLYADMLGVDPNLIVASEEVALVRQQRAQAQQAAQQAALAEQQSKTAKNLAQSPTSGDNALTNVMDNLTGYNTPGPVGGQE
jgi:hypothetical protein